LFLRFFLISRNEICLLTLLLMLLPNVKIRKMSAKDKSFFLKPRFLKISLCFSLIVFLLAFGACRTPEKT